jgi:hypothetical protein
MPSTPPEIPLPRPGLNAADAETQRLEADARREANWKRWGPYLSERQWGTVREDYSPDGSCWSYLPHDHARSRAYRWGEDGLLGVCDRECRMCFALALWNGRDAILKERLFGLTNGEGNHGEDVKECYFYLDSTPTHSYMKALYKYPHAAYPYDSLVAENRRRGPAEPEYELLDTGVFNDDRYFDVFAEYAKAAPEDLLIRITIANRAPEAAIIHVLPTLWFRNTWSWGRRGEGYDAHPHVERHDASSIRAEHDTLGRYVLRAPPGPDGQEPLWLFTENETNGHRLFGLPGAGRYFKDAFHDYVVHQRRDAINPKPQGTKAAAVYRLMMPARSEAVLELRLGALGQVPEQAFGEEFAAVFAQRRREADEFYARRLPAGVNEASRQVVRQAYAGLLWSKQFYHYAVREWLEGDPSQPDPPPQRRAVRNSDWLHLYNRDVISMPDKWEYPWYAAWDLAFHMMPFARIDLDFAKQQLILMLREWYMHPNGQIPAYEFAFSDVNPPVHAWACWRVYTMSGARGHRDRRFLARVFQKLLMNFTWWVNRKDVEGKHLFAGGFLGLDNIGVFDRGAPLPVGGGAHLEQADGTAWMAFYALTMLAMALELACEEPAYEDVASKFFEHFVAIADAMNTLGGSGLWDDADGFYYDQLHADGIAQPLKVRSIVGLIPLCAAVVLDEDVIRKLPGFAKRMRWFLENRSDLARHISYYETLQEDRARAHHLLAIPSRPRLEHALRYMLDENEFLSPFGIRSVSRFHAAHPYIFRSEDQEYRVDYLPGESNNSLFGGNSNWRGPIWFPINFLLIESLERYHHFYGDTLRIECPTGSGRLMDLQEVADELRRRLSRIFLPDEHGRRPCHGAEERYARDPQWRDFVLFYEYFHGDNGRGVGASHQTGWTALVARCIEDAARPTKNRSVRAGRGESATGSAPAAAIKAL